MKQKKITKNEGGKVNPGVRLKIQFDNLAIMYAEDESQI